MKHRKKRWKDPLIPSMGRSTISMGHGFHVANSKKLPCRVTIKIWDCDGFHGTIYSNLRKDYRMVIYHSYKLVYKPLQPSLTIEMIMLYHVISTINHGIQPLFSATERQLDWGPLSWATSMTGWNPPLLHFVFVVQFTSPVLFWLRFQA